MSFTINNRSDFGQPNPNTRKPIVIEGERSTEPTQKNSRQTLNAQHQIQSPFDRVIEAYPVKDNTAFSSTDLIYKPTSPLSAFSSVSHDNHATHHTLGSTIDTFV